MFVANHPYGVLDGIVISWLVEKVRSDFVVLTNAVLMRAPEVRDFILPIDSPRPRRRGRPISHRAPRRAPSSNAAARSWCFPPAASRPRPIVSAASPAVDARWQPFVAQLIQRSKATVVPIWFGGQNSRLFQIASHVSLTLRLSLIFHEVKTRIGAGLPVAIGAPIPFADIAAIKDRQALADHLRELIYALAAGAPKERPKTAPRAS